MTLAPEKIADADGIVLIIFSGDTDIRWLKMLKHGFRHCFACVHTHGQSQEQSHGQWIFYDPLAHVTGLTVHHGMDSVDLEFWFRQHGCTVVRTSLRPIARKKSPPAFFTCVEAIKRLLGIHTLFVITPWQLYRHLQNNQAVFDQESLPSKT